MPAVRIDTHSAAAACAFVREGLGVSVLPELLVAQFAGGALVLRPPDAPIRHRFLVGSLAGLHRSRPVEEFAQVAQATTTQLIEQPSHSTQGAACCLFRHPAPRRPGRP